MPTKTLNKSSREALILKARAGIIPASDHLAEEVRQRVARTGRIGRTVAAYAKLRECRSERLAIVYILADLRHHCDCEGLAFDELDKSAIDVYDDEAAESHMNSHNYPSNLVTAQAANTD